MPKESFEATVMRLNRHWAECLAILAEGLGKTWDASDLAYFASAIGKSEDVVDTLRKVYAGEKLAGSK